MANKLPPGQQQTVRGTIDSTPCPHCGRANDLRGLHEQQLLDTGAEIYCDHCGYSMQVTAIRPVTIVTVRKNPKGGRAGAKPGQPARQPQQPQVQAGGVGGFIRGLLGGPGTKR